MTILSVWWDIQEEQLDNNPKIYAYLYYPNLVTSKQVWAEIILSLVKKPRVSLRHNNAGSNIAVLT